MNIYKFGGKDVELRLEIIIEEPDDHFRVALYNLGNERPFFEYNEYPKQIDTMAAECRVPGTDKFVMLPYNGEDDDQKQLTLRDWAIESANGYVDEDIMREIKLDLSTFTEDYPDELIESIREFFDCHIPRVFREAAEKELDRTDYVLVWWEDTLAKDVEGYTYDGQVKSLNDWINNAANVIMPESIQDVQQLRTKTEPLDIIANGSPKLKRQAQFIIVNRDGGVQPMYKINNGILRSVIATEELGDSVRIAGISQYRLDQTPDWIMDNCYNQPKLIELVEAVKEGDTN